MRRVARLLAPAIVCAACTAGDRGGGDGDDDPPPPATVEQSLAWVQPALLDDPSVAGLDRVMRAFAGGAHGGTLLEDWFDAFATTAHSQRYGPSLLADSWRAEYGMDASQWDLDALPFKVTGVHNRLDLMSREREGDGGHCGELRVSMASTDPSQQPLHVIFLFRQPAGEGDADEDGVHCRATSRRWAELAPLDETAFLDAARAILDEGLVAENAILAESVEQTVTPWEWRQWEITGGGAPSNPPLFQAVDVERLNDPGATRDAFLAFVEENAAALDARTMEIPSQYRSASQRLADGVPREVLDLTGVDAGVLAAYPDLRKNVEIVGCPVCHTADAPFVQTTPNRTFSEFYTKELEARRVVLDAIAAGESPAIPFGPLQPDPVLPE